MDITDCIDSEQILIASGNKKLRLSYVHEYKVSRQVEKDIGGTAIILGHDCLIETSLRWNTDKITDESILSNLGHRLSESKLWKALGIRASLAITEPSRSKLYSDIKLHLTRFQSSLSGAERLMAENYPVSYLRSLKIDLYFFPAHSEGKRDGKQAVMYSRYLEEICELADKALRDVLLNKMSKSAPAVFAPGYITALEQQSRYIPKAATELMKSISAINDSNGTPSEPPTFEEIQRRFWERLVIKLRNTRPKKFLKNILADTQNGLNDANMLTEEIAVAKEGDGSNFDDSWETVVCGVEQPLHPSKDVSAEMSLDQGCKESLDNTEEDDYNSVTTHFASPFNPDTSWPSTENAFLDDSHYMHQVVPEKRSYTEFLQSEDDTYLRMTYNEWNNQQVDSSRGCPLFLDREAVTIEDDEMLL